MASRDCAEWFGKETGTVTRFGVVIDRREKIRAHLHQQHSLVRDMDPW